MPGIQIVDRSTDNIGKWVLQYRNIHGLRQKDLARMAGVSRRIVSMLESGRYKHEKIRGYVNIASALGITLDTLLEPLDSSKIKHSGNTFEEVSKRSHQIAKRKEWWLDYDESPRRFKPYILATKIALIASEVSEAMEAARENHYVQHTVDGKPEGVVVELADAIIRIFDFCEKLGLDLKGALLDKLNFNEGRPVKHGKVF